MHSQPQMARLWSVHRLFDANCTQIAHNSWFYQSTRKQSGNTSQEGTNLLSLLVHDTYSNALTMNNTFAAFINCNCSKVKVNFYIF